MTHAPFPPRPPVSVQWALFGTTWPKAADTVRHDHAQAARRAPRRSAVVRRLAERLGAPAAEATIPRVEALYHHTDPVRPVMRELLATLRKKHVRLGLLSNAPMGTAAKAKASGLSAMFDAAVFAGDVGVAKPDPAAFQLVARKLHTLPERCLFVDDVPEYVDAASVLGMRGHVYHWTRHHELEAVLHEVRLLD